MTTKKEHQVRELYKLEYLTFEDDKIKRDAAYARDAFIIKHQRWIDMLNEWREGKKIPTDPKMESRFQQWQLQNNLLLLPVNKYKDQDEFIQAWLEWMYENLKSVSRGSAGELLDVGKFGKREIQAIFSNAKTVIDFSLSNVDVYVPDSEETFIPSIARYTKNYLSYMRELILGLRGMAKFGILKVGVCPYQRRREIECGKVFVGDRWNSEACKEHSELWKKKKYYRKYTRK